MAIYFADSFPNNLAFGSHTGAGLFPIPFRFTVATAFLAGDTVNLTQIPGGAYLAKYKIWLPQLDSGAALTVNLGDSGAGNGSLYVSGAAVGRSATYNLLSDEMCWNGATAIAPVNAALPVNYSQATPLNMLNLVLTIATAPGVGLATGKIKGMIWMCPNGIVPLV